MGLSLIYKFNTVSSTESLECINEMAIFLSQPLRYDSSALTRIVLDFGEDVYPCHSYAVILYALKRLCVERKISLTFRLPSRSKNSNLIQFFSDTGIDSILEDEAKDRLRDEFAACRKNDDRLSANVGVHNLKVPQDLTAQSIDQFMDNFKKILVDIQDLIKSKDIDSLDKYLKKHKNI